MLVFLLFLFCIFPSQIFAAPTITITNFPELVSTQTPTQTPTPVPEILGIATTNKKNISL